ncbi:MAG: hypothetical protein U1E56_02885 [Bauldia sp.]
MLDRRSFLVGGLAAPVTALAAPLLAADPRPGVGSRPHFHCQDRPIILMSGSAEPASLLGMGPVVTTQAEQQ